MRVGKYKFESLAKAELKIKGLGVEIDEDGNEQPTHKHTIVKIGHIVEIEGVYDDEGNLITEPTLSVDYCVDVIWVGINTHPYGWKSYDANINSEGVHGFFGVKYIDNKI